MHLTRLVPVVLAALSAAVAGQTSDGEIATESRMVSQPRAGQYRSVLELLEFEAPGASADQSRSMRDVVAEELALGNDFCLKSGPVAGVTDQRLLEHIAEGECRFDRFAMNGVAASAAMSCTGEASVDSEVTIDGRIWGENADLDMTLQQEFPGVGPTRIRVRVQTARVGDC